MFYDFFCRAKGKLAIGKKPRRVRNGPRPTKREHIKRENEKNWFGRRKNCMKITFSFMQASKLYFTQKITGAPEFAVKNAY